MTETPAPDEVTKVARNLTAIEDMTAQLLTQAVHKANDAMMPGGAAMVSLAAVASPQAWEHIFEAAEHNGRDVTYADDHDDDWEPVLQTLLFWSEAWREEHGYLLDKRPTIESEANFIRWCINWAWENEVHWDDFARDMHKARLRLEDVLHAGRRAERTRVNCTEPNCERKPRLIKVYGWDNDGGRDYHKCPACKTDYDAEDFTRAFAKQLRSDGAAKFVKIADAIGTLRAQGRPERTIRKWFEECQVEAWCDQKTREVWVWWPDLWRLHLSTQSRKRSA